MNAQIPEQIIDEIRKANDIVDVIGEYVSLKKQGRNYFGLCPFHGEKTPSFSVTQEKQIFHCFGCGKGGNVFTFLMEQEGFSFQQAVTYLAQRSGFSMPDQYIQQEGHKDQSNDQVSLQAHELLTKFYHHIFSHAKEAEDARAYLKNRGLTDETIECFQIGFSPEAQEVTPQFLEKKAFNLQELVSSGVLARNDQGQVYDRMRGRLIFPIRNHLSKTVGFGGRSITELEPKYLNSPESALFQKGKMLFNFDLARSELKKTGQAILFEGYMDVITAYQGNIKNGIASLGTSITEQQAALIKRYVNTVVICYDGDEAGINASFKAAKLMAKVGCQVRIATLPDGHDPDSFIRKYGGERFKQEVIEVSSTYMGFIMMYHKRAYNLNVEADQMAYVRKIVTEIAQLKSALDRDRYIRELTKMFDLSSEAIQEEVNQIRKKQETTRHKVDTTSHTNDRILKGKTKKLLPAYHNAERKLIAYMLFDRSIAEQIKHTLGADFNIEEHQIIVTYLYAFYEDGFEPNVSHFVERLKDDEIISEVIEIAMEPVTTDFSEEELSDYVHIIKAEHNDKVIIRNLIAEQKQAELKKDFLKAAQIGMEIMRIQKELRTKN
ncbi:DNA primase [Amphibacillus sp. MSJ-3]|uniref:DNA primase n=1 Tax=Amphibacillus sp. MSJ-3 TaxID=2841505 RepID=UPI001C0F2241|nr:DNA primase [Amphibacillus sp. MSJ-3]MBU5595158.1 DNA primase [Amphibacillus sp. MSJ-3]